MSNHLSLSSLFPDLSGGQNGVYFQGARGAGALAGEADVMMISGLGADAVPAGTPPAGVSVVGAPPSVPAPSLTGQLSLPVTLGPLTLPVWQWLVLAALLGGAGGYYLGRR